MEIKLKYVTYEQAKALKEIGYPQDRHKLGYTTCDCWDRFNTYKEGVKTENASHMVKKVTAPTLELAVKWLREEKGILLAVHPTYNCATNKFSNCYSCFMYFNYKEGNDCHLTDDYETYEEALSKGIDIAIDKVISKMV